MPDVIQCPTCSKRFKLPERPPAVFTCTGCGTAMDLSGFRAAAPAPAPVAAAPAEEDEAPASSSEGGDERPSRSSSRGGSGGRGRGASRSAGKSRAGARSRRGRADDDDDADGEGEEGGRRPGPPKTNPALLWGSLGGLVVIIAVVMVVMKKKSHPAPEEPAKTTSSAAASPGPTPLPGAAPVSPAGPAMGGSAESPSAALPTEPAKPPTAAKGVIHEVGHHPDATDAEQKKIDDLIQTAVFRNEGADSRRAERELVSIGIKAAPRLINVFHTVQAGEGFAGKSGADKCFIADRALRGIDGYIDRKSKGRLTLITPNSDVKFIETVVKYWFSWWDGDLWKTPQKPWDERSEGNRGEKPDKPDEPAGMGDAPAPMDAGGGTPDK